MDIHIAEAQYQQACNYNKTADEVVLTPGDFVYLYNPAVPKGMVAKLHRPYDGPYRLILLVGENGCIIQKPEGGRTKRVHRNRLKICYRRATR